jgi:uncharacterized membrane protein YdjX (TVP38/TMEM64 family)
MLSLSEPTASRLRRMLPLIVILVSAIAGAVLLRDHLSFEALRDNREMLLSFRDSHYIATMIGFVMIYTLIVTFSLPGAGVASITGGFLFTLFPGVLLNMVAATLGASFVFLAARRGLGAAMATKMEKSEGIAKRLKDRIDESQWSVLFMVRLVPVLPFFLMNLVLSAVGVPLSRFAISTFFGIIPGALVFTSIGAGIDEVFAAGGNPDLGIIFAPHILLPMLGLAGLAALPMILKAFKKDTAL